MSIFLNLRKRFRHEGFRLPQEPFGVGDTERCIEIPWALSCYRGEKRVLDVGYANAEERYLEGLRSLGIPQLYGLDRIKKYVAGIIPVVGDIRKTDFPDGFFDLVFCISTLEHVGRDNSIYFQATEPRDDLGDFKSINEISRIIRKNGRIVLTVPFGKFCDYGWFIQYDWKRWNALIEASGCISISQNFFIYQNGWQKCSPRDLEEILYKDNCASAAAGLVCVLLEKKCPH
jgi:SAM-dependent methyltransferase